MNIPRPGAQVTKQGMTLTIDFVSDGEVYYKKHRQKPHGEPDSLESDWSRFIGFFRVPISTWNAQTV